MKVHRSNHTYINPAFDVTFKLFNMNKIPKTGLFNIDYKLSMKGNHHHYIDNLLFNKNGYLKVENLKHYDYTISLSQSESNICNNTCPYLIKETGKSSINCEPCETKNHLLSLNETLLSDLNASKFKSICNSINTDDDYIIYLKH